ncbi:MAG: exodeoxyribonuclease VII small subunit [Collinsella sp.]|nr:exodeoxyribonuclease VII small subunit [Collinsella sp.]
MAPTGGKTFDDITERLDEIVSQVRSKDTSLERSLDLFDEAIKLGSEAVDMVDRFELSPREEELLDASEAGATPAAAGAEAEAASEPTPAEGA